MITARRVVRLVLVLTAAALSAPAARAQDEPPEMAPPEAPVTMDTAIEQIDAKRNVAIKLPKDWKSVKYTGDDRAVLSQYRGFYSQNMGDDGLVVLTAVPWTSRALLALHVDLAADGVLVPELTRTGPGFAEGAIASNVALFRRYVEKDGQVFAATVYAHSKDQTKAMAQKILDTFRVTAKPPAAPAPPAHLTAKKSGEFDVWTDAKKDNETNLAKTMELASAAREFLAKSMGKAKPFDEWRPILRAYSAGDKYEDDLKPILGAAPEFGGYEPSGRFVAAPLYKIARPDYAPAIQLAVSQQFVIQYFGGRPPIWVEHGLAYYGLIGGEAGGKIQKPLAERIRQTNLKCNGKRSLEDWMNVRESREMPDQAAADAELGAWHYFIRNGPGKKYRKQYDAYMDALRASGDAVAARKAWDGTDFGAMKTEFAAWYPTWQ